MAVTITRILRIRVYAAATQKKTGYLSIIASLSGSMRHLAAASAVAQRIKLVRRSLLAPRNIPKATAALLCMQT